MAKQTPIFLFYLLFVLFILSSSASSSTQHRKRVQNDLVSKHPLRIIAANTTSAKPPTNTQPPPKTIPINQYGTETGPTNTSNGPSTSTIIAAVCGTIGVVVAIAVAVRLFCCLKRRTSKAAPLPPPRQSVHLGPSMSSPFAYPFDDASSDGTRGTRSMYRASKYGGSTPSLRQSVYSPAPPSPKHNNPNRQSMYSVQNSRQSIYAGSARAYSPSRTSAYGSKAPSISSRKSAPARPISQVQRPGSFIYMPQTSTLSHLSSTHPSMRAREIIPPLPLAPKQGSYVRGDATNRVINFEPTVGMGIGPFDEGLDFDELGKRYEEQVMAPDYGDYLTASPVISPEDGTDASSAASPEGSNMSLATAPTVTPSSSISSGTGSHQGQALRKRAPTIGDYPQGRSRTPEPQVAIATIPPTPKPVEAELAVEAVSNSADQEFIADSQRASIASFTTATDSVVFEDAEEEFDLDLSSHMYYRDVPEERLPPAPTAQLANLLAS